MPSMRMFGDFLCNLRDQELEEFRTDVKLIFVCNEVFSDCSWIKSARVLREHVQSPAVTPPAFGPQEQFDEGGVE